MAIDALSGLLVTRLYHGRGMLLVNESAVLGEIILLSRTTYRFQCLPLEFDLETASARVPGRHCWGFFGVLRVEYRWMHYAMKRVIK